MANMTEPGATRSDNLSLENELSSLVAATAHLTEANKQFQVLYADVAKMSVHDATIAYQQFKDIYDSMIEQQKQVTKNLNSLKNGLMPEMIQEGGDWPLTNQEIGRRFSISTRVSCSMADKEAGLQWLKDNGHGGIIQEVVNSNTLSSFAKSYVEETGKDLPDNLFNMNSMTYITSTRV